MVDTTHWDRRDKIIAAAGTLLLWTSFLGWFGITWDYGTPAGSGTASMSANAWNASSAWATAVVLGLIAAVLWTARERGRYASRWLAPVAALLVAGALALVGSGWVASHPEGGGIGVAVLSETLHGDDPSGSHPSAWMEARPPTRAGPSGIRRDELMTYDGSGYHAGVRPGLRLGVLFLTVELAALLPAAWRAVRRAA